MTAISNLPMAIGGGRVRIYGETKTMKELNQLREKYAKRECGATMRHAPGGADVLALCDTVGALVKVVRNAIGSVQNVDAQRQLELDLLRALRNLP